MVRTLLSLGSVTGDLEDCHYQNIDMSRMPLLMFALTDLPVGRVEAMKTDYTKIILGFVPQPNLH